MDMIGKTVSHYKITEKLGEGGMGVVYKALDEKLNRKVAVKFLPEDMTRDPEAKKRFVREAQAASALEHSNICNIHEIDETEDGQTFIVMAYYKGETLRDRIRRSPLEVQEAVETALQIAEGLNEAHKKGIVHRDIKSTNIIVTDMGQVKIMDFGLAKLSGKTKLTKTGTALGTVAYMSPEQAQGRKLDRRTDLWSLGVVLYEMLTGVTPFAGEYDQAVLYSILSEEPRPVTGLRTGIPAELDRIIGKALCKDAGERYQHADDLIADLRHFQRAAGKVPGTVLSASQRTIPPEPEKTAAPLKKTSGRVRDLVTAAAGLFVIVTLFFLGRLFLRSRSSGEPIPVTVISFENQTGSPQYDYLMKAIPNLLITSLEQSRYLRVTTWERMRDLIKQLGKEEPQIIDRDLGFELCRMDGVKSIILGSFTKAGEQFATDVKVLDVETKRMVAGAQSNGDGEASILKNQIDALSKEIARGIGLAREAREEARPIAEITTQSMEAYSYFLLGRDKFENIDTFDSIRLLTRAVELDSSFAIAWLYLGEANNRISNIIARNSMITRAYQLSSRATGKERMYIEAGYAKRVDVNLTRATEILEAMRTRFPNEKQVRYELSLNYVTLGKHEEAIVELREGIRLDPNHGPSMNQLGYEYMALGRFEEAVKCLRRYTELMPNEPNPYDSMGDCYFNMGNLDSAMVLYREALKRKPDFFGSGYKLGLLNALLENYEEGLKCFEEAMFRMGQETGGGLAFMGMIFSMSGRYSEAMESSTRSRTLWDSRGAVGMSPIMDCMRIWSLLGQDKMAEAESLASGIIGRTNGVKVREYSRGWIYSILVLGEIDVMRNRYGSAREKIAMLQDSLSILDDWARDVVDYERKRLHGNLLLALGQTDSAIALLKSLDLPRQPSLYSPNMGWYNLPTSLPSHCDVLARAYLAKGDLKSAAREYERLTVFDPENKDMRMIHPLLHFRLAQVYESMGLREKAVVRYTRFLDLWKKAEGDPPELREAKTSFQNLR